MAIVKKTIFDKITMYYHTEWKNIGTSSSGGIDSSLTLYLMADEFKKENLTINIQPISYIVHHKPSQEPYLKNVVEAVRNLTNYEYIKDPIFKHLDPEESLGKNKNTAIKKYNLKMFKKHELSGWYVSDTLNPPDNVRLSWTNDDQRSPWRDVPRGGVHRGQSMWHIKPVVRLNKSDIIKVYKDLNLVDSLLPLTISCDESYNGVEYYNLPYPCGECWWCKERRWGMESNGIDYEKYTK